jgi:hypothetical protein
MYIVFDKLTDTLVGPFNEEEEAIQFSMEAADLINDHSQNLDIYEIVEPQQWALDNLAVEIATA